MKASVDGSYISQYFGLPSSLVTSLEPAMWHDGNRKAYWLAVSGYTYSTHFHPGIDRAATYGTPVIAMEQGTVSFAGWKDNISGYQVEVQVNAHCRFSVNHLSRITVHKGQSVDKGQMIGRVGQTGYATGPHTHEGLALQDSAGRWILWDPALFLYGGKYADDPRIQPTVRKFHVNGPGINIRLAPPDLGELPFATSRADGIYRRDGKRLSGLAYGFTFLYWRWVDNVKWAIGMGYGKKLAIAASLIHF